MPFDSARLDKSFGVKEVRDTLGSSLRAARKQRGLSQRALAAAAQIDVETIGALERGAGTLAPLRSVLSVLERRFVDQPAEVSVGDWLVRERSRQRMTQQSLAMVSGVSKPTIIQLERDRGSVTTLITVAMALGITMRLGTGIEHHDDGVRYGTLCSGIEAVSQAWMPLGWRPVMFAENASFPSAVLAHRYPSVPNLGDITKIDGAPWRGKLDVLWASTPCTSFSMAGDRQGLKEASGALTGEFARLCDEIDPEVLVWENVKGALVDDGNAFGDLLAKLAGEERPLEPAGGRWTNAGCVLGPKRSLAWRVLDAQYAGLAQRRERLFVVGCRRDGIDPREILFERDGPRRHRPPVRTQRHGHPDRAGEGIVYVNGDARPKVAIGIANTLKADTGSGGRACILQYDRVRRLMPIECERLMGLEDDTTAIRWKGKPAPDTLRWQAVGNSVAVPDVRWIGQRITAALIAAREEPKATRGQAELFTR